jgi:hypothetical protein
MVTQNKATQARVASLCASLRLHNTFGITGMSMLGAKSADAMANLLSEMAQEIDRCHDRIEELNNELVTLRGNEHV